MHLTYTPLYITLTNIPAHVYVYAYVYIESTVLVPTQASLISSVK